MHRSGTSAMTGCLQRIGITIGSKFLTDLYEQVDLVKINETLLNDMGSCWDDLFCLPKSWSQLPMVERYHKEIAKIVLQEFGRHEIWALKDPRISILLPLWIDIFNRLSIVPHFLIAIRNPFEVARSLMARDRFCQSKSLALWMKYFLSAEYYSRSYKRTFYYFDELIAAPVETVQNIFIKLAITPPLGWDQSGYNLNHYIKQGLKHHNAAKPIAGEIGLPPQFKALYQILFPNGKRTKDLSFDFYALDNLREQFEMYQNFYLSQSLHHACMNFQENEKKLLTILYDVVNQYVQNRQYEQATKLLSDLTDVFPEHPSVWNNHGMAHELKKDYTTAVSSFQKAIELSPGYELAHNNLRRLKQRISDL